MTACLCYGKKVKKNKSVAGAFAQKDRQILESIKPIVDGIALFLGKDCEVLLHSFENLERSVIYIANGHITGRTVGSPITDLGMKLLNDAEPPASHMPEYYFSKTASGKTLRSASIMIRNSAKKPIGMLCINFNMSAPLEHILDTFSCSVRQSFSEESPENFVTSVEELVKTTLGEITKNINSHSGIPNNAKNKTIVRELAGKGIFNIRGAIDIVARELSVSRYTIYNYMREIKFSAKKEDL
jgi:predicted transcriptional regulator YheO